MALIEALGTVLTGGLTGLLGSALTTTFGFFNQKAKNKHELAMRKLDHELMVKEAEIGMQVTEAELQGDLALSMEESRREALKQTAQDKLAGTTLDKLFDHKWTTPFGVFIAVLFGLLDFIKGFIRPGMTLYMTVLVTMIYLSAKQTLNQPGLGLTAPQALELIHQLLDTVMFVFTTITLWWFGERAPARIMRQQNNLKE